MLSLSSCGAKETEKTEDEVITSLIEPTVMITVGEYRGTGVIIGKDDSQVTIASVAHLLDGYDQGIVSFYGGKTGFADVFYLDSLTDICLLKINCEDMDSEFINSLKTATIDLDKYEEASEDDTVYVVSSVVNVAANVYKGTLKSKDYYVPEYDQSFLYLYCEATEGMSGSGCYDEEGSLLGLVSAGTDTGEVVCIPIKDYIEKWRICTND